MFFHACVDQGNFLFVLKHANITPAYKKGCRGSKDNYYPVAFPQLSPRYFKTICVCK